ncbi:hypothetical protein Ga0076813_11287 [endosymbiont of Ridgeia piscesae]|uniref:Uncharacterized protein n=1 Tax=endosymbiont of Ridgeia piscesae TaxID=54398 RepID=A0A0T5Z3B7_9GAMM|nr:hypothetical protein Ga0076813_11287 [endosymbiont of Ridgeia piscesae]
MDLPVIASRLFLQILALGEDLFDLTHLDHSTLLQIGGAVRGAGHLFFFHLIWV